LERAYLRSADVVVSLTGAAKVEIEALDYLKGRCPRITIIPTCVDLGRFQIRELNDGSLGDAGPDNRFTLVYSGSLGTWYLLDEMLVFFLVLKKHVPDALFLVLTRSSRDVVETAAHKYGLGNRDLSVHSIPFQQMPEWIAAGGAGVFFSAPSWANKARCPTKLAEFLAVGLPVVINRGIGDMETIVPEERVGVVVEQFTETAYEKALVALFDLLSEGGLKQRCRRVAEHYFSLDAGVRKYQEAYEAIKNA
jgi:glycosyltransferase involved in cell wall biosynthesis